MISFKSGALKHRAERGDTLVEVLIATAIISMVLVGAYITTNRNTISLQDSQEREQAQRLVQGQIEMLRANNGITASGNCFSGGVETSTCNNFTASNSGATYTLKVTATGNLYTVSATWVSLTSKTDTDLSNVTMYYRLK